jgi:hypothetical protein
MSVLRIPQGQFSLTSRMDDRVRQLSGAAPRVGDVAFPIFAFVGALGGMGWKIIDVAAALGLDFGRGPVLARSRLSFARPLLVDRTYAVEAWVETVDRKPSRTYGTADHVHLTARLSTDEAHSTARLHIVFPGA